MDFYTPHVKPRREVGCLCFRTVNLSNFSFVCWVQSQERTISSPQFVRMKQQTRDTRLNFLCTKNRNDAMHFFLTQQVTVRHVKPTGGCLCSRSVHLANFYSRIGLAFISFKIIDWLIWSTLGRPLLVIILVRRVYEKLYFQFSLPLGARAVFCCCRCVELNDSERNDVILQRSIANRKSYPI